ncbi:hypothetical protein GXB85_04535 [Cellulomonas sp. APG4]|uniref:hypothetical protein n=1 Tax=Cellulomonas sp. APG4 TaxID=1538656 RepID=UPI00137B87D2|nr:hypothetical protein [Cellulomonas sp. APG4]NCT90221.1 hypothetical protein [Cellulomonas sp. APG4]
MSTATPADVPGRQPPARFFDDRGVNGHPTTPAQRRAQARNGLLVATKRLGSALDALCGHEDDLDLTLERFDRALDRFDAARAEFDAVLAAAADQIPRPTARRRTASP